MVQKLRICCLFIFFFSLTIFSFSSSATVRIEHDNGELTYKFSIDDVRNGNVVLDERDFAKVELVGVDGYEAIIYREGAPEIPAVRFYVDAESENDIEVLIDQNKSFLDRKSIQKPIMPNQPSLAKIKGLLPVFKMSHAIYKENQYMPAKDFDIEPAGSIRGKSRYLVSVYPFKYNPVDNSYIIKKFFSIKIRNTSFREEAQKTDAIAFIIGNKFSQGPAVLKYMEFKKQLGYEIIPLIVGKDVFTAQDIRSRLQNIYRSEKYNLKHAVLIGDAADVPSYTTSLIKGVTDHYYRAIDTDDYSTDINGPDIGVGRITVNSENELNRVVEKMIKYQTGTFKKEEWLNRPAFIATDDRWQVAEGTHNYVLDNFMKSRNYVGYFPNSPNAGGDQLYAITYKVSDSKVVETMRDGRFIINYSGHGSNTSWAGPHVSQSDVRSLTDREYIPFVIGNACITGDFRVAESFGETWIKNSAIMYWGSMDSSYWDEDDILEKHMYDGIYTKNKKSFNALTNHALSEVWRYYGGANRSKYYWETYVIFGDPSIDLRTSKTTSIVMEGELGNIVVGMKDLSYMVKDETGAPIKNMRIALTQKDGAYTFSTYSDDNGAVNILLNPKSVPGEKYLLTAYGDNARLFQKELQVISPDVPYFMLSDIKLNGRTSRDVYVGEEVDVRLKIKNISPMASKGGMLKASIESGNASFIYNDVSFLQIDGNSSLYTDGIRFKVGDNAKSLDKIDLVLHWSNHEGQSGVLKYSLNIAKAVISITETHSPNVAAGDSGEVRFVIKNDGDNTLNQAVLFPSAGKCVQDVSGEIKIDKLEPGASIDVGPIFVTTDELCKNGDRAEIILTGDHQGPISMERIMITASFDVGKLGYAVASATTPVTILDLNTIQVPLQIDEEVDVIQSISLKVKINHSYIGDLVISLVNPAGERVVVREKGGGSADDIDEIYGAGGIEVKELEKFIGTNALGTWMLEISDLHGGDSGRLDQAELKILGYLSK